MGGRRAREGNFGASRSGQDELEGTAGRIQSLCVTLEPEHGEDQLLRTTTLPPMAVACLRNFFLCTSAAQLNPSSGSTLGPCLPLSKPRKNKFLFRPVSPRGLHGGGVIQWSVGVESTWMGQQGWSMGK